MTDHDPASLVRQPMPPKVRILTKGYISGTNPVPRQQAHEHEHEHVPTKLPKGGSSVVPPARLSSEKAK